MSASPGEQSSGRTPNGANPPRPFIRRPRIADPLVRPKARKPAATSQPVRSATGKPNPTASQPRRPGVGPRANGHLHRPTPPATADHSSTTLLGVAAEPTASGFSAKDVGTYTDYPLVISKKDLVEGLRHHVARLASKKPVNVADENEFTRPVRLHRRDPRAPAIGAPREPPAVKDEVQDAERERLELLKAQRKAQRELDMAEVAPSTNVPNSKRTGVSTKAQQVFRKDETEAQRASTRLKYEEALPWHIEDFDNKQTWVGTYEAALSETYAEFALRDGKFFAVPLEKWYKFTQERKVKSEEELKAEAERRRQLRQAPDFLKRQQEADEVREAELKARKANSGLYGGKKESVQSIKMEGARSIKKEEDADEIDFDDQATDDDEDQLYEGDNEDTKETEKRIRQDQIKANAFDLRDEKIYEAEEKLEKAERQAQKEQGRQTRKALKRLERNYIYDSDSDHPYSESSASETDKPKTETNDDDKVAKTAPTGSGVSTRGNNTPSHRPGKHAEAMQRTASFGSSLKRSGSPSVSDLSGNESSRKKLKKNAAGMASSGHLGTATSTPSAPPSRPRSPAMAGGFTADTGGATAGAQRKPTAPRGAELKRTRTGTGGAGSGSEGEGAGSGGEMSDGSRKRIKLKVQNASSGNAGTASPGNAGQPASASGSRAGSPAPPGLAAVGRGGSFSATSPPALPTAAQIRAAIPEQGISIAELLKIFPRTAASGERRDRFFKLLKTVSHYEKASKVLKPI